MSSSAKRVQKLRQGQSDEKAKATNARNAQRNRDKRAAAKNAKIKNSQQLDQKSPHESSSLSLGTDDSGFDTMNALEATSISSQCATTMTPVRGSSLRGLRKGMFSYLWMKIYQML
ncbi:hypothetical protein Ddc_09137 [Ditylenchus destructor]|nr:hypothetical protein Ddc_09137 [Ditylenchus destructor]